MVNKTSVAADNAFTERFANSGFAVHIDETALKALKSDTLKNLEVGQMQSVYSFGGYEGFLLKTKTGNLMVFRLASAIMYQAEDSLAICQSWKKAGLGSEGVVQTLEQLQHIFAIPDSYK